MTRGVVATAAAVALCGATVLAHHSIAGVYDSSQPVTVEGLVTEYRFVNPHPFVDIEVPDAEGRVQRWRLELDNLRELAAVGMSASTLRASDRLVVTGSRARDRSRSVYVRSLLRPADGFLYEQIGSSPRVRLPGNR